MENLFRSFIFGNHSIKLIAVFLSIFFLLSFFLKEMSDRRWMNGILKDRSCNAIHDYCWIMFKWFA
jgi:hypothetical protein